MLNAAGAADPLRDRSPRQGPGDRAGTIPASEGSDTTASEFEFRTATAYDPAGVRFNVAITAPPDGSEGAFTLTVDDVASGDRVALNHQACPAVHDFTRGFARWIGSRGHSRGAR